MALPVTKFEDPWLSQPIQRAPWLTGIEKGVGLVGQLDEMRQKAAMAPLKRELTGAQAELARAKAAQPFAGQALTGVPGEAYSEWLYRKKLLGQTVTPEDAQRFLQHAQERKMRMANARLFGMMPVAERGRVIGQGRTLGYTSGETMYYLNRGYTLGEMQEWKRTGQKPPMETEISKPSVPGTAPGAAPITHPAENFSNAHLPHANAEVDHNTRPIDATQIKPTPAAQTGAIASQQKATVASAGMDYMGQQVKKGLNYGGLFSVVTRPWYWDANSKDSAKQEKAVKYYAAQSIKPELSLYRIKLQGGQASARAIKAIEPTILGSVKTNLSYLPAKIQKRIQQRVMDVLNGANAAASRQLRSPHPTRYIAPKRGVAKGRRHISNLSDAELDRIIKGSK